jgi:undecaprenyl-diphosphatase
LPGDVAITLAIQAWESPALDGLARVLTEIGRWYGVALIATLVVLTLAVRGAPREAVFVALAAIAGAINTLSKVIVASARPTADLVLIVQPADGTGFPSGHAFAATLLYGAIWIVAPVVTHDAARRRLLRAVAIVMAVGICWSRIRLGAHWPSDVLGGVLLGLLALSLLAALVLTGRKTEDGRRKNGSAS